MHICRDPLHPPRSQLAPRRRRVYPVLPDLAHYEAAGSGEGIARFIAGVVDFGASDVPQSSAQAAKIERGVIQIPSTAVMVVLAYNLPGGTSELKLPQDVYVDIFMGRIRTGDGLRI